MANRKAKDDAKFAVGDVVRLQSGGPQLTVVNPQESNAASYFVRVAWFDQTLALINSLLPQDCLRLVQKAPPPATLGEALVADATEKPAGYVDILEQVGH